MSYPDNYRQPERLSTETEMEMVVNPNRQLPVHRDSRNPRLSKAQSSRTENPPERTRAACL